MDLNLNYTEPKRAADIEIPDAYFNRILTGAPKVDAMFGGGILPGCTFTIDAGPGTGKSSFALQLSQLLVALKYRAALLSGEQNIFMVAMATKRLKTPDVYIAAEKRLSIIMETIKENDLVIIDSYPSVSYDFADADELTDAKKDEHILNKICESAQQSKCAVGLILHVTKAGGYKGSTILKHTVDVNISISKPENDPDVRVISFTKNRLGPTDDTSFKFGAAGYDFYSDVVVTSAQTDKKMSKKEQQCQDILAMKDQISLQTVGNMLGCNNEKSLELIYHLVHQNKLVKSGYFFVRV